MSASPIHALDAIAFQLASTLDQYELDFNALIHNWPELELYAGVSKRIDELRMYSAALPELSVPYVLLLIAHAELVHALWKTGTAQGFAPEALARVRSDHHAAVADMRRNCLRLLATMAAARERDLS